MKIDATETITTGPWKEESIFSEGDSFFDAVFQAIESAQKSIKMETYIFEYDTLGIQILNALSRAADRGVKVKLLLDGAGCSEWSHEDTDPHRKKNFEIRFFHPLLWQRRKLKIWKYLNLQRVVKGLGLMNHRNHRKVLIIDDDIALLGSMNITQKHLSKERSGQSWRDTSVRVAGPKVAVLHESFDEAWNYFHNYQLRYNRRSPLHDTKPLLHLNRTRLERKNSNQALMERLSNAQKTILITNPYFIPNLKLIQILKTAIQKKVEVIALFPSVSDVWQAKFAMEAFYSSMLKAGLQIYEYQPAMIHSKVLITDNQALIGTTNLNTRSFFLDLEVDIEITHPENREKLKNQFYEDLKNSKKVDFHEWKKRPFMRKFLENIFLLFRWML